MCFLSADCRIKDEGWSSLLLLQRLQPAATLMGVLWTHPLPFQFEDVLVAVFVFRWAVLSNVRVCVRSVRLSPNFFEQFEVEIRQQMQLCQMQFCTLEGVFLQSFHIQLSTTFYILELCPKRHCRVVTPPCGLHLQKSARSTPQAVCQCA